MKFTLKKTLLTAVVMAMIGCVSKETKNTVHDGGAPGREYVVAPDGVGTNYTAAAPGPLFGLAERIAADWKAGAKGRHDEIVIRPGYYRFDCLPRVETRDTTPARIGLLLAGNALEVRGETGVAADVVLDGCGGEGRAFSFAGSGEVTVRGITFQNFRVTKASGAALAFGINATTNLVENCTFRGNSTDGSGGATASSRATGRRRAARMWPATTGAFPLGRRTVFFAATRRRSRAARDAAASSPIARSRRIPVRRAAVPRWSETSLRHCTSTDASSAATRRR